MSEAMTIPPPLDGAGTKRTPTVYFIDDSATMREVIKIAFRRENMNVITCADAASALAQFEVNRPDVVITDVIMPDQDGYSVCTHIKQHPEFGSTPVVLMSGVVNKSVADKAVSVKADELIRKPFQPQELIGRVKSLLEPKTATAVLPGRRPDASSALSSFLRRRPVRQPNAPPPLRPRQPTRELPSRSGLVLWQKHLLPGQRRILLHRQTRNNPARLARGSHSVRPISTSCAQRSPGSSCSSRNCKRNCRSNVNTIKHWNCRCKR